MLGWHSFKPVSELYNVKLQYSRLRRVLKTIKIIIKMVKFLSKCILAAICGTIIGRSIGG